MSALRRFALALVAAGLAGSAFAGGPLYTFDPVNRIQYAWHMERWPNGQVPVLTDLGPLSAAISNARANEMVLEAASQWSSVPTSSFRATIHGDFSQIGLGDINFSNIESVIGVFNEGGIDVVYDTDGSIMEDFFGLPADGVLGITNIEYTETGTPEILEAFVVLSGPGVHQNDPAGLGFQGVVTHEMGHALNLAHTQTNGAVENLSVLDDAVPGGCAAPWNASVSPQQVETMYPISTPEPGKSGEGMGSVDTVDDMAALSDIYPAVGYPNNRGTIRGTLRDAAGNQIMGVNVIARNPGDPFNDVSSSISGQLSKGGAGPDGSFELNGLTPGARYLLYVDRLEVGAFSVPRIAVLPGLEEFFNGTMESGDASTDGRCGYTTVKPVAGAPLTADITFNHLPGAPTFLQAPNGVGIPTDITPDGSVVVGGTQNPGPDPGPVFKWDLNAGTFEELGGLWTGGVAISDDGTKIAANVRDTDDILKFAIYQNGAWTTLPPVTGAVACDNGTGGPSYGSVYDISGDGNTVVGLSYGAGGCYTGTTRGFKWTSAGGTVALPKIDTFDRAGRANAVNYNGSVIVGWDDASTGLRRGAQWRNGVGSLIRRGTQPVGEALDVSRDGQYVVGSINFATSGQAWRYTPSSGVELLGVGLPGQTGGVTNAISDDYGVITGYGINLNAGTQAPTLWTSGLHTVDLNQFLGTQGVNTEGANIGTGTAVSADGRTIAGQMATQFGYAPWVLKIPTVLVCHAGQTTTVSFPQGMHAALAQGDTLGPCQCSAAAPTGLAVLLAEKPLPGTVRFTWGPVAGATGYDFTRGTLSALRSSGGNFFAATNACLEDDLIATTGDDGEMPAPGVGYWYVVRATSCGGVASYDSGAPSQVESRDTEIQSSSFACP